MKRTKPTLVAASKYVIEKGVPIEGKARNRKPPKYPFAAMELGDSFFAEGINQNTLNQSARNYARQDPTKKFIIRTVVGGSRVWRIS